jgi:hypothetical protein
MSASTARISTSFQVVQNDELRGPAPRLNASLPAGFQAAWALSCGLGARGERPAAPYS